MRKLILMMGASASGKSSFIEKHHLEKYVISADKIREQFGCESMTYTDNHLVEYLHSNHERPVWQVFYQQLKARMEKGITTIIDNTNVNFTTLKEIRKYVSAYNYEVTTVDFMSLYFPHVKDSAFTKKYPAFEFEPVLTAESKSDALDQLIKNNDSRDSYHVADSVIRKQVYAYSDLWTHIMHDPSWWSWLNTTTPNDDIEQNVKLYNAFYMDKVIDLDQFKRIQVIGDIHNDYAALMKVFDSHEPGTAYIFLGDYLDKGTRPYSTFNFLAEQLLGSKNLFFIRGNHEDMWQDYLVKGKVDEQFKKTYEILIKQYGEKRLKKLLSAFLSFCRDYYVFTYHGKIFYASHAGIEPDIVQENKPLNLLPSKFFTYGLGNDFNFYDPYGRNVDQAWGKLNVDCYNLHGHRNNFNEFVDGNSINLNLESKFRWLTITPDSMTPHEINSIDSLRFDQAMAVDPFIWTHNMSDDIKAYNFTKEAWTSQHWDKHTSSARGLFIRNDNHQIVGRGFPKFFELGENGHAKLNNLEFPVSIMRKHDGFLALVCYDTKLNKLHVYSKSGETDMAEIARKVLIKTGYLDKAKYYFSDKNLRDTTLLFEIIDPKHDWHIVNYDKSQAFPLAVIENDQVGIWLNEKPDDKHKASKIFREWCVDEINSASWIDTIDQLDDTQFAHADAVKRLKRTIQEDEDMFPYAEGVVLYGQNMMLKVKFNYYHKLKETKLALFNYLKHGYLKNNWHYGARSWSQLLVLLGYGNYTKDELNRLMPHLGLKLDAFDKQYNIKKLLAQSCLQKSATGKISALWDNVEKIKSLWDNFNPDIEDITETTTKPIGK